VGHADPPLSDRGRADIAALLTASAYRPDLLLSSDLRRSRESAEILAAHWGIEVVADARLRELNFGEWEGRTWKELEQVDGVRLARWMRDWTRESTPGGESFPDLIARVSGWIMHWAGNLSQTAATTVVVAHAGSIRAILCQVLGVPLERAFELEVGHARATCLDLGGATPSVVCRNANTWPSAPAAEGQF
jgi:alpha-ribazole phosphatase